MTRTCLLFSGLLLVTASCGSNEPFRGNDYGALLAAARAHWRLRPMRQDPARFASAPGIEAGGSWVQGDFEQGATRPDYEFLTGHIAFAPELAWRNVDVMPLVGASLASLEVTNGGTRIDENGAGALFGIEASYRALPWLQPYARATRGVRPEWVVDRVEVGLDLRLNEAVGVQVGWARQTTRLDDGPFFGAFEDADIRTDGVHVGLSLRF